MSFNLDSLFVEWRSKVSTGVPNPKNAYHLVLLKEICLNRGIDVKIVDDVILALEQDDKKVDPETIVKYKGEDGEEKESKYSYASKQPEGTPAKIAANKLKDGGKDDTPKEDPTSVAGQELQSDPEKGGTYMKKKDDVEDVDAQDDAQPKDKPKSAIQSVTSESIDGIDGKNKDNT